MPTPRCSAEFQEYQLGKCPACVGCDGFVPDGLSRRSGGKAPKRMWAPIPRVELSGVSAGASPSRPPVIVDKFNRQLGGNWPAVEAAARVNRPTEAAAEDFSEVTVAGFLDNEWF